MKLLFSSASTPEIGLLKSLLDEDGIICEVRNENSYSNFPGAGFQPEIWVVDERDYFKACEIRDAFQFSQSAGRSALAGDSPQEIRANRILAGLTGLLMVVLAVVCAAGFVAARVPTRVGGAVVFGSLGVLLVWLALVGWRGGGNKQ